MRHVTLAARRAQRFLRRPPPPRWLRPALAGGACALALVVGGALSWWASEADLLARARAAVVDAALDWTRDLGLAVAEVYVDGRARTPHEELLATIATTRGDPLLGVDPQDLRQRLEGLPWVEQASVSRYFPGTVHIRILERRPLALWQRSGRYALVDRSGAVIDGALPGPQDAARYRHLRVLVGERAPEHATDLFAMLASEPELWSRVVAAIRVGDRRWNVRLDNRVDVLLPEDNMLAAWRFLARKAREDALLERAVTVVDLRFLPERMRLKVDPAAVEDGQA